MVSLMLALRLRLVVEALGRRLSLFIYCFFVLEFYDMVNTSLGGHLGTVESLLVFVVVC